MYRESSCKENRSDQCNVDNEDERTVKLLGTQEEINGDGRGLCVHLKDIYKTADILSRNNFQSFLHGSCSGYSINQSLSLTSGQTYLACLLQSS